MKKGNLFALINFLIIFLILFIEFEIIKLESNLINYIVCGIICGGLIYLYPKLFDNKINSK